LFLRVTDDVRRSITPTEEADEVLTLIDYHSAFDMNFLHSSVQYHIIVGVDGPLPPPSSSSSFRLRTPPASVCGRSMRLDAWTSTWGALFVLVSNTTSLSLEEWATTIDEHWH
jgi:hypothetical protein